MEKFGGYKTEVKERIEIRERLALKNSVEGEELLEIYGTFKRRDWYENVFTRPQWTTRKR